MIHGGRKEKAEIATSSFTLPPLMGPPIRGPSGKVFYSKSKRSRLLCEDQGPHLRARGGEVGGEGSLTLICLLSESSGKAFDSTRVRGLISGSMALMRPQRVPRARVAVSKTALHAPARARPAEASLLMETPWIRKG